VNKNPAVSVLMAVYNTPFYLVKRAIDSVLNQDFDDLEMILIDDGSTNDTNNQMLDYAKKYDGKITYIRHHNCGQSRSINRGIRNCNGNYIAILDADDEYMPNHLSNCLQQMNNADLIASTTLTIVDKEDDYYVPDKHDNSQLIHVDDCVLFATLFGTREVFTSLQFQSIYAADAHFFEQAALRFRVKKVNLRSYIYYRNIAGSITANMKIKNSKAFV
jgi:glycosyltransferase involved in cell wall biosynthesis